MEQDEALELIGRLCAAAGMIMEDASADAVSWPVEGDHLDQHLRSLAEAGQDVGYLAAAAEVIVRRLRKVR